MIHPKTSFEAGSLRMLVCNLARPLLLRRKPSMTTPRRRRRQDEDGSLLRLPAVEAGYSFHCGQAFTDATELAFTAVVSNSLPVNVYAVSPGSSTLVKP